MCEAHFVVLLRAVVDMWPRDRQQMDDRQTDVGNPHIAGPTISWKDYIIDGREALWISHRGTECHVLGWVTVCGRVNHLGM